VIILLSNGSKQNRFSKIWEVFLNGLYRKDFRFFGLVAWVGIKAEKLLKV